MGLGSWILIAGAAFNLVAGLSFCFLEGKNGMGIAYICYAIANVGLAMEAMR